MSDTVTEDEIKGEFDKMKVLYNQDERSMLWYHRLGEYQFNKDESFIELPFEVDYDHSKSLVENLEEVFRMMNIYQSNPMAQTSDDDEEGKRKQEWLRKNMEHPHTSMCTGDAVKIGDEILVVDEFGFTKYEDIEDKMKED